MVQVSDAEYLLAQTTAEEYRKKGYEVSREVPLDFFPDFYADLVVRKGTETKVIEVKRRSSLAADPRLRELARILDSKPGWRFELLLVGEPEKVDVPEDSYSLGEEGISQRLEDAERAVTLGLAEAGFVLAWSGLEARLRMLASAEGAPDEGITTASFALEQAACLGVISREDYGHLNDMRMCRNGIVHGVNPKGFNSEAVTELIDTVRRLKPFD